MKYQHHAGWAAALFFAALMSTSYGQVTYIDSLSQTLDLAQTFDSAGEGYDFTTDGGNYDLSRINVSIVGLKEPIVFHASIFQVDDQGLPVGAALATTSLAEDFDASNPNLTLGIHLISFDFNSLSLQPNTTYSFVAGADSDIAYEIWGSTTAGFLRPGGGSWVVQSFADDYYSGGWHKGTVEYTPALQISAYSTSAVPESASYSIFGLGALGIGMVMKRRRA